MKQILRFLSPVFIFFNAVAGMPPVAKPGDLTQEPRKYALQHSETPDSNVSQFDCKQCSSMKDLIFVSVWKECGNAGCGYSIFRKAGVSYNYITKAFLHPGVFEFLKTTHNSLSDYIFYHHNSSADASIERWEYNGRSYQLVKSEKVLSQDFRKFIANPEKVEEISFSRDLKRIER